jgi:predicted dehydrogenase
MLEGETLDALAILCPPEAHERYLAEAAAAGLHALCEKPLLWGGSGLGRRARGIVERFADAGLLLRENCQWPYVLPALRSLHPRAFEEPTRRFFMRLSPAAGGARLLADCLPHPLSVLQALLPSARARVERARFRELAPGGDGAPDLANLAVEFDYHAGQQEVGVDLELRYAERVPRAASIGLNGFRAERDVGVNDYKLRLVSDDRAVDLPDPLTALVRDFVRDLATVRSGRRAPGGESISQRMECLEAIARAFGAWSVAQSKLEKVDSRAGGTPCDPSWEV